MLITKKQAADMIGVPVAWVDGMLELGALGWSVSPDGSIMIDADEILEKRYVSPELRAVSLGHVKEMLRKVRQSAG